MPFDQILYLSRATQYVDRTELTAITTVSVRNNRDSGVTGVLLFCDGYFLQILEGDGAAIDAILSRIALDVRHTDLQIIRRNTGIDRTFPDWTMACLHESAMSTADRARTASCIGMISDPTLVDHIGNDAHQLLVELYDTIAAVA